MYELLSVIALIISIVSLIFVGLKEGISLALGFRESEAVERKRSRIKEALRKELEKEVNDFLNEYRSKEAVDEETMDSIVYLSGRIESIDLVDDLMEALTYHANRFLKCLSTTVILVCLTALTIYFLINNMDTLTTFYTIIFGAATFLQGSGAYSSIRKYYYVREAFQRLSEDPTLDNCEFIGSELEDEGILP